MLVGVYSTDINECQTDLAECDKQADCYNTIGSYLCICNKGLYGDGFYCSGRFASFHWLLVNVSHVTDGNIGKQNCRSVLNLQPRARARSLLRQTC